MRATASETLFDCLLDSPGETNVGIASALPLSGGRCRPIDPTDTDTPATGEPVNAPGQAEGLGCATDRLPGHPPCGVQQGGPGRPVRGSASGDDPSQT